MHHSSVPWEITFPRFFSWNFISFGKTGPKSKIKIKSFSHFWLITWNFIKCVMCNRLLLLKVYKISTEKSTEDLCLMALKRDAQFEEKPICCFKNNKNLVNFDLSTWNSQYFYFDWSLLWKVYNVWPKKVQRSYLSWPWRVIQNLKKNWLVVCKTTSGIWQIFTRELESLKNGNLMRSFYLK